MNKVRLPLCLLLVTAAFSAQPAPQTRTFDFDYVARIPSVPPGARKIRLWVPVPQSDAHQQIANLKINSAFRYELHQDPEYHDQCAYIEMAAPKAPALVELKMQMRVQRRENRVDLGHPAKARKDPAELSRALQPDQRVPLDGVIATLSAEQTRNIERPLDKARAIYNYVVSTMRYDKSGDGWGRGDAIFACNARRGNCTDFHALFIGMMRAAGIPAKFEIGFPLPADKRAGEIPGYHCWAQFWLDDFGWIPVDASEAWKNPAKRDYFFGAHDDNRVMFSRGRDIRLNPAQQGEPLNYFVYPYAEVDGKAFAGVESKFSFRDVMPPGASTGQ